MWKRLHVKHLLFLSDLNKTWVFLTDFRKRLKYKISSKSVQWESSCSMPTDGWMDGYDKANSRFSRFWERSLKTDVQLQKRKLKRPQVQWRCKYNYSIQHDVQGTQVHNTEKYLNKLAKVSRRLAHFQKTNNQPNYDKYL